MKPFPYGYKMCRKAQDTHMPAQDCSHWNDVVMIFDACAKPNVLYCTGKYHVRFTRYGWDFVGACPKQGLIAAEKKK